MSSLSFISLEAAGGLGGRNNYKLRFDGPVAGLIKGSAVLFNGVRVGEVTKLTLDSSQPEQVFVTIAITPETPVRSDTKVSIDFQGLAGAPVVALVGGSPSLPLLRPGNADAQLLVAEKDAGVGMTQMARQVLQRLDAVVADNADPLKSTISSINTFAAALARNSNKVDGIVAGLERFTGAGKDQLHVVDLTPAKPDPGPSKIPSSRVLILEPTALAKIDSERIRVIGGATRRLDLSQVRWPDILSKVIQTRIVQSFENGGYSGAVPRTMEDVQTDYRLMTNIRSFQIRMDINASAQAEVEFAVKIVDSEGLIVASRILSTGQKVSELNREAAIAALDQADREALAELVVWTCEVLSQKSP